MANTTANQRRLDSDVDADQLALYAASRPGVVLLQGITADPLAGPTRIPGAVTPAAYTKRSIAYGGRKQSATWRAAAWDQALRVESSTRRTAPSSNEADVASRCEPRGRLSGASA
jgi:hypothetical protein